MNNNRTLRNKIVVIFFTALAAATVIYIWSNSFLTPEKSSEESGNVYQFFLPVLDFFFGEGVVSHEMFRDMAHFFEFWVFGLEMGVLGTHTRRKFLFGITSGPICAFLDEFIQVFTNRSPEIPDFLLDVLGFGFGFITILGLKILIELCQRDEEDW